MALYRVTGGSLWGVTVGGHLGVTEGGHVSLIEETLVPCETKRQVSDCCQRRSSLPLQGDSKH